MVAACNVCVFARAEMLSADAVLALCSHAYRSLAQTYLSQMRHVWHKELLTLCSQACLSLAQAYLKPSLGQTQLTQMQNCPQRCGNSGIWRHRSVIQTPCPSPCQVR